MKLLAEGTIVEKVSCLKMVMMVMKIKNRGPVAADVEGQS